mmetsp:Transcript_19071/g.29263  ORF Transcript_19071/g.29263 Transcript_19071/m.29263 type:complete len:83 (+) Transcript_19071:1116-1364(+)
MRMLNSHPAFFGVNRVSRPPVMCWGNEQFTRSFLELGTTVHDKEKQVKDPNTEQASQNFRFEMVEEAKGNGDREDFVDEADK